MAIIEETWVVHKALAVVLWFSRLYSIAPIRFQYQGKTTVVYISRPLHYLGIIFIILLNVLFIYTVIAHKTQGSILSEKSKSNLILTYITLFITIAGTMYSALNNALKLKKYFQFIVEINKIIENLNNRYTLEQKTWHSVSLIALLFVQLWIMPLVQLSAEIYIAMPPLYMYGCLYLTICHFMLVVLHIKSAFGVINKCLADVLSEISRESTNQCSTSFSRSVISFSHIPITSINRTIDMLGNVKRDVIMTPRMKLARQLRIISSSFVRTCELVRDLNDIENVILLMHVVICSLDLVGTLTHLIDAARNTDFKYGAVIIECIWLVFHNIKIVLLVEPCHRLQEEFLRIKIHVARIMCEVDCEADPLFDATNDFIKQIDLNVVSVTVMRIFSLGRSTISTIITGATTLYILLLEF